MSSVKGLLKGLRYISQIFDNEKDGEIQIGYPTDVKHVAHIGSDGPSMDSPSWMDGFQNAPRPLNSTREDTNQPPAANQEKKIQNPNEDHKSKRESLSENGSPVNSPTKRTSNASKQARRHHRSSGETSGKPRTHRRQQNLNPGSESDDPPAIPKHTRRRKSKGSSVGESTGVSKSKGQNNTVGEMCDPLSDPGIGHG